MSSIFFPIPITLIKSYIITQYMYLILILDTNFQYIQNVNIKSMIFPNTNFSTPLIMQKQHFYYVTFEQYIKSFKLIDFLIHLMNKRQ